MRFARKRYGPKGAYLGVDVVVGAEHGEAGAVRGALHLEGGEWGGGGKGKGREGPCQSNMLTTSTAAATCSRPCVREQEGEEGVMGVREPT